jgi:hypothetical protein
MKTTWSIIDTLRLKEEAEKCASKVATPLIKITGVHMSLRFT